MIDSEKRQIEATLAQAKAEHDLASLNLGYTEIRSPIDGVIGNRSARAGAYATVGAQLLSIVPAHGLWIDANFNESQLAHMTVGQTVEITAPKVWTCADAYLAIAICFAVAFLMVPFMQKVATPKAPSPDAH